MSDLSRLLDDLYATAETETESGTPRAPAWSSAEALDEVFSAWVPGSLDDGAAGPTPDEVVVVADDAWLTDTEPAPALVAARRWSPSDDDILPSRSMRRRRR